MKIANQDRTAIYDLDNAYGIKAENGFVYIFFPEANVVVGDYHGGLNDYYADQVFRQYPKLTRDKRNLAAEAVIGEIWERMQREDDFFCMPYSYPTTSDADERWDWMTEKWEEDL